MKRGLLSGLLFAATIASVGGGAVESSAAAGWTASVVQEGGPSSMVVVDKKDQRFFYYEKGQKLQLKREWECSTGKVEGDKIKRGDLRTPEGVYFVKKRVEEKLDFDEYGSAAFALNYPNPVDILRGKTGSGIWIHSKGKGITPRDTRGCVAIGLEEISELGPKICPGMPAVFAQRVASVPALADDGTRAHLQKLMEAWSGACASRSDRMFEFYNQQAYGRSSGKSFKNFRAAQKKAFAGLEWMRIYNRPVYVLEGPGYWVSWAEQYTLTPKGTTEGTRRLYWQRNSAGEFRIVGMEWEPQDLGMEADVKSGAVKDTGEAWRAKGGGRTSLVFRTVPSKPGYAKPGSPKMIRDDKRMVNLEYSTDAVLEAVGEWVRKRPGVTVSNVAVWHVPYGVRVQMFEQEHTATGLVQGKRGLILAQENGRWTVVSEDWKP